MFLQYVRKNKLPGKRRKVNEVLSGSEMGVIGGEMEYGLWWGRVTSSRLTIYVDGGLFAKAPRL